MEAHLCVCPQLKPNQLLYPEQLSWDNLETMQDKSYDAAQLVVAV